MALPKWLQIAEALAPEILAFTPLAPIAAPVAAGIQLAQQIAGASGAQKAAIVQQIAVTAAQAANAQAGKVVVDPAAVQNAAAAAITTTVSVINLIHDAHQAANAPASPSPAVVPAA